ncbi:MAG: TRAP transporter small permease subunit [Pseudomonadota bacterium]
MQRLIESLERVNRIVGGSLKWFALLMLLIQFFIVIARYVFGYSSIALQESLLYLHAALFMLGAGYTLLVDAHVRIDIFYAKRSAAVQRRIDLIGHTLLLMPAMLTIIYFSWPAVRNSWAILEGPISVGGLKAVFLLKSLIPAFCLLVLVQSGACTLRLILEPSHKHG